MHLFVTIEQDIHTLHQQMNHFHQREARPAMHLTTSEYGVDLGFPEIQLLLKPVIQLF